MHGPTPASIPGGQVITTKGLVDLMNGGQTPVLLLDVLGGQEIIQNAQYAVPAAQPGSFNDQTQQGFGQYLQQATGGNKQYPIGLYCLSPQCGCRTSRSARDQSGLHQRPLVPRRHRELETGRDAGAARAQ